jgi:hypothetical protein
MPSRYAGNRQAIENSVSMAKQVQRRNEGLTFRVQPRLLTLLGEQLIRDANLAVFELVKNAYDADATMCLVTLENPDNQATGRIVVEDDGVGMDEDTLRNVWMVIATDFRLKQRAAAARSQRFSRFPLGEKGLGRLSIHKLGRSIRLITRVQGGDELVMDFDWDAIESATDLDEAYVALERRKPEIFTGDKHGTMFHVTRLREVWSRGELRRLYRSVNSLCSPFQGPTDFEVTLSAPGKEEWLKGMFSAEDANKCAIYHVRGSFEGETASFDYDFTPPEQYSKQLAKRHKQLTDIKLGKKDGRSAISVDLSKHQIGRVDFDFWLFDRDPAVLRAVTGDIKGLKDYLDENGGIRISQLASPSVCVIDDEEQDFKPILTSLNELFVSCIHLSGAIGGLPPQRTSAPGYPTCGDGWRDLIEAGGSSDE